MTNWLHGCCQNIWYFHLQASDNPIQMLFYCSLQSVGKVFFKLSDQVLGKQQYVQLNSDGNS